jgi:hypothetical protein
VGPTKVVGDLVSRGNQCAKAQRLTALVSVGHTDKAFMSLASSPRHQCHSSSIRARAFSTI